jgi:hypothetical protein
MKPTELILKGRLATSYIFNPFESKEGEHKKSWKLDLIFDPRSPEGAEQIKKIEAVIKTVCLDKWKKYPLTWPDAKRLCLRDGNLKIDKTDEVRDGYADMKYLTCSRNCVTNRGPNTPPGVFDRDKTPLGVGSTYPYNGCYVMVHVDLFGTEKGGRGIFAELISVKMSREGDPLLGGGAGAVVSADVFGDEEEI